MLKEIISPWRNIMFNLHLPSFGLFNRDAAVPKTLRFPPRRKWRHSERVEVPLGSYIERFLGESHAHRAEAMKDAYVLFVSSGDGYIHEYRIFRDCSFTIVLALKEDESPLACIGFDVSRLRNIITVGQLQGVSMERWGKKRNKQIARYLLPLRWEQMLLTLLRDYAREEGFRLIRVIPARKQTYYGIDTAPAEENFARRYESTPRALGFTRSRYGYHVYPLTE